MLTEICGYLRNWFERAKYIGKFEIVDGKISTNIEMTLLENQYIRIVGSVLNDGVYQYHADGIEGLSDEVFDGAVWALAIPKAVIEIADKIDEWETKYSNTINSPYSSESLSASSYSYTKAAADSVGKMTWENAFAADLAQWRKI